jgi:DNA-directed RNA polymerase specialized sigma24 family protein
MLGDRAAAEDVVQDAFAGLYRRWPQLTDQREALVLRYYLDLPDSEIAAAMAVGASTVRSTVHRGLAALERILGQELS